MLKPLLEFVRQALFLQQDMRRLQGDVASLTRELHDTNEALRQLAFEVQRINEREVHEREKLMLRLENTLLRSERLLPPPKEARKSHCAPRLRGTQFRLLCQPSLHTG